MQPPWDGVSDLDWVEESREALLDIMQRPPDGLTQEPCSKMCEHCNPEAIHRCQLGKGHERRDHSCDAGASYP